MAITNGTFDTDLSGWITSGAGDYDAIWDAGRARLRIFKCADVYLRQTISINQNTLKFDYWTTSQSGVVNVAWKLTRSDLVVLYDEAIPWVVGSTSGTIAKSVAAHIGQTAILEFRILRDPTSCAGQLTTYMWIDNVINVSTGVVYFTSSPTNARIWLDNVDKGVYTPYTIADLSTGNHTYKLTKPGWPDVTGSFSATAGQTTNISGTFSLTIPWYTVIASDNLKWSDDTQHSWMCDESAVTNNCVLPYSMCGKMRLYYEYNWGGNFYDYIYVEAQLNDGYIEGTRVSDSTGYDATTHAFTVDFDICASAGSIIKLVTGGCPDQSASIQNARISYDLTDGGASFTSSPTAARIWIDNVDKGVDTPSTIINVSPGSHTYKLTKAGYADATGNFSTTVGTVTTVPLVTLTLAVVGGDAAFTSTPAGAAIWIDDVSIGQATPYIKTGLSAGLHTYRLIKIGYTKRGSFSITEGQTTNISDTLTVIGLNGSTWIENEYLCYINTSNIVTYVVGTSSGAVAGSPGSTWIEGTQLVYIDASNNKRLLPVTTLGTVVGLNGSLWIDGNYLYYIASGIQRYVTI